MIQPVTPDVHDSRERKCCFTVGRRYTGESEWSESVVSRQDQEEIERTANRVPCHV
jgi:hypothetical protein